MASVLLSEYKASCLAHYLAGCHDTGSAGPAGLLDASIFAPNSKSSRPYGVSMPCGLGHVSQTSFAQIFEHGALGRAPLRKVTAFDGDGEEGNDKSENVEAETSEDTEQKARDNTPADKFEKRDDGFLGAVVNGSGADEKKEVCFLDAKRVFLCSDDDSGVQLKDGTQLTEAVKIAATNLCKGAGGKGKVSLYVDFLTATTEEDKVNRVRQIMEAKTWNAHGILIIKAGAEGAKSGTCEQLIIEADKRDSHEEFQVNENSDGKQTANIRILEVTREDITKDGGEGIDAEKLEKKVREAVEQPEVNGA